MSMLLHLPNALQANISVFTSDLDVSKETSILDKLLEKECLSEYDYERVLSKQTSADQVRLLVRKIKDRGSKVIETFLEILDESEVYKFLVQKVRDSVEKIAQAQKDKPLCVVCLMRLSVDIKDIFDYFWKENMISDEMHGQITESESMYQYRSAFWDEVLYSINGLQTPQMAFDVLKEALGGSYSYLVDYLKQVSRRTVECFCCRRRNLRPRPGKSFYESESEYSTTSKNLPSRDLLQGGDDNDSQSDFSSLDIKPSSALSFDRLDHFDSIGSKDSANFSPIFLEIRKRHTSGDFVPKTDPNVDSDGHDTSLQYIGIHNELTEQPLNTGVQGFMDVPKYERGLSQTSTTTVQTDKSSSDNANGPFARHSSASDVVFSPDSTVQNPFPVSDLVIEGHKKDINVPPNVTESSSLNVHQRLGSEAEGGYADIEDNLEKEVMSRKRFSSKAKSRKGMRNNFDTNFSSAKLVTSSRNVEPTSSKLPLGRIVSRKSKTSKKRELRRQKSCRGDPESPGFNIQPSTTHDEEDKGLKIPYHPLRGTIPQPKLVPKWDYHQAQRYRKMNDFMAVPKINVETDKTSKCRSDTDFRTEESETVTFSDYTV